MGSSLKFQQMVQIINKSIWKLLNEELCSNHFNGLLPFINCTLHTVHNAFGKAIVVLGEDAEHLAFDLHAWFKVRILLIIMILFS